MQLLIKIKQNNGRVIQMLVENLEMDTNAGVMRYFIKGEMFEREIDFLLMGIKVIE